MKNNNRRISAVFFTLFFAFLCLIFRMPMVQMSLTNSPMVIVVEFAALLIFGWVTVKAFASAEPFTCSQKAQLCAVSGLYLLINLAAIEMEQSLVAASLSTFNQALASNQVLCWVLFAAKFVLLGLALVFAFVEEKQATVVFEEGAAPEELQSEEAIEALTEQLDEAEEKPEA